VGASDEREGRVPVAFYELCPSAADPGAEALAAWAPAATIAQFRSELAAERSTEAYAKKQAAGAKRRENTQREYVEDFRGAVLDFLGFHPRHANLAGALARAVTSHESAVGEAKA
jgi:hypothetical protein